MDDIGIRISKTNYYKMQRKRELESETETIHRKKQDKFVKRDT